MELHADVENWKTMSDQFGRLNSRYWVANLELRTQIKPGSNCISVWLLVFVDNVSKSAWTANGCTLIAESP